LNSPATALALQAVRRLAWWSSLFLLLGVALTQLVLVLLTVRHEDSRVLDQVDAAATDAAAKVRSELLRTQQSLQALALSAAELTEREAEGMRLVIEGLPNKRIADALGISVRRVEVHRAHVFEKMDVKSAVELANRLRDAPG
jgi:DNA-binding CsgD family transcriptional regulator